MLIEGAEGGQGFIENAIFDTAKVNEETYKKYITGRIIW
jgi:hypothetical protein